MATKEDILEQVVEEYLTHKGYFVQHNIKFKPNANHPDYVRNKDSNHSDIDVIGYAPHLEGHMKVMVVSCKSWQGGFNPLLTIDAVEKDKKIAGRSAWKSFRELVSPKWTEAFIETIQQRSGSNEFTYVTAVAKLVGRKSTWQDHEPYLAALQGNPIRILTFEEMLLEVQADLTTTLAATEIGRFLQLIKASGVTLKAKDTET